MKCCSFCSNEAVKLFSHLIYDLGSLCIECYMRLHGSCGACASSLLPLDPIPDVSYRVQAMFLGLGDKTLLVCNSCFESVHKEFTYMFEGLKGD